MAKYCTDCGKSIPEYMRYCPQCADKRGIKTTVVKRENVEQEKEEPCGRCNFITAYIRMFKKFHTAKGRSRRSEYWYIYIIDLIFKYLFATGTIYAINNSREQVELLPGYYAMVSSDTTWLLLVIFVIISLVYSLTIKWAIICLTVRRLHDVGKRGWWCFLKLSLIGEIVLAVFLAKDSQVGRNMYGADPKAQERNSK